MHQLHFLIPDPASFRSGGNVYNACLIRELVKKEIHVSHDGFNPDIFLASPDTLYVLDSIYFDEIDKPEVQIPGHCIGLIHHLRSLYPLSPEHFKQHELPVLCSFEGFIVSSSFTRKYLVDNGFDANKIHVIEPSPMISPDIPRQPTAKVHALMVGACIPRKGQLAFLEALDRTDIPPYYTLTVVGSVGADEQYARQCAEIIVQSNTLKSCVRFLGEQDTSTIEQLYAKANLFVSAAEMETFGMAIQDAVASGIPVLALDRGYAAQHVKEGVNGVRCASMSGLIEEFEKCVLEMNHFKELQGRAMNYKAPYHSWREAARKMIEALKLRPPTFLSQS